MRHDDYKQLKTVTKKDGVAVDYQVSDCLTSAVLPWTPVPSEKTGLHQSAFLSLSNITGWRRRDAFARGGECQREG